MTHDPSNPPKPPLTRRSLLQGIGAAIGAATVGCGESGLTQGAAGTSGSTGEITGAGGGGASSSSASSTSSAGGGGAGGAGGSGGAGGGGGSGPSCTGNGGLSPEELLAGVETIVVLCMENRSFDHYLGALSLLEGRAIDGLKGGETNPDPNGKPVGIYKLDDYTVESPPHGWDAVHKQWNGGACDGFVIQHEGANQGEVMGYHTRADLPVIYALADGAAVCDRYFCSVLGPTWPNRFYLHGATSQGQKGNLPVLGFKGIFNLLKEAGIEAKNYYSDVAWCAGAYFKLDGLAKIEEFFDDAAAGKLPPFSIIDPGFFGAGANDDHPDHDVQLGQALIAGVFAALAKGPQWDKCLFVLTYDEHGGFFDHVPPPKTVDDDQAFAQLGFRVPAIVAGPFCRKGCAVSEVYEHASVLRTVQKRFDLPSLNARMEAANDLSACIEPAYLNDPQPPPALPMVKVSLKALRAPRPVHISQPELWAMAESGLIPPHLDRRSESLEIVERILAYAVKLGAVELV